MQQQYTDRNVALLVHIVYCFWANRSLNLYIAAHFRGFVYALQ
jgi:hypothetical protein